MGALYVRSTTATIDISQASRFLFVAIPVQLLALYVVGVYHRLWSKTSGHGVTVLLYAVAAATLIDLVRALSENPRSMPVSVVLLANFLAFSGFVIVRYRSRLINAVSWRWRAIWREEFPKSKTRVLIAGADENGQALAVRLKYRIHDQDYSVIGFVDNDTEKQGMYIEDCPVLGEWEAIPRLAKKHLIDLIVIAADQIPGAEFRKLLEYCDRTDARIQVLPNLDELMTTTHSGALLRDVQPEDLLGRNPISRHSSVDLTPLKRKTILVTGAAGSIGSELCRQLVSFEPVRLLLLDNNESGLHDLEGELSARAAPNIILMPLLADITDDESIIRIFETYRPEIVFHAAAYKHVPMLQNHPREALRVNIGGTFMLAEVAQAYNVERFVLVSTDKAVNPSSVMGASKRACERIIYSLSKRVINQTLFTSVRFGNVLGSRGSVVPTFNRQIDSGGPVTVTHPDVTRYFMTIPEAVNLVLHAACMTDGDDVFILNMGETVLIRELAQRMIRLRGLRPEKDVTIEYTGMRPGEKLHEELYDQTEMPVETIHPHIIKLCNGVVVLNTVQFLTDVREVLRRTISEREVPDLIRLLGGVQPAITKRVHSPRRFTAITPVSRSPKSDLIRVRAQSLR
jgi:FlaA1/EpsC-like NDP-sugar epimerase